ncbi:MAG: hypothetical protein ACYCO3_16835 [Mycobacteriales bacterium]
MSGAVTAAQGHDQVCRPAEGSQCRHAPADGLDLRAPTIPQMATTPPSSTSSRQAAGPIATDPAGRNGNG